MIEKYRKIISGLPDHGPDEIRIANEQLEKLEFSFNIGKLNIDLFSMTKKDVLEEIEKIAGYDFETLAATRNFEPEYIAGESKQEWMDRAKEMRIELIVREFSHLSRLRSNDPEAWDLVNELWFDD